MYTGYELTENSRKILLDRFPPKYRDLIGHHITEKFGVRADEAAPDAPRSVTAVAYADDGVMVEGFVVEIDGSDKRPSGGTYHLTWSIDRSKGAKPVHTNEILHMAKPIDPIQLEVIPRNFNRKIR